MLPTLDEIEQAAGIVYAAMPATPQYCWPLLCERLGCEIWVKHENHTSVGAFKVRGGLVYFAALAAEKKLLRGVISATRGNHGQSVGLAARRYAIPALIVVPRRNSEEKNAAMRALGVELIEHGDDFQASKEHAEMLAREKSLHMVPSYHRLLVAGVATYCVELLRGVPDLQTVYVAIGLGSGISAMIAARNALGAKTEVVGVVSSHARAYAESFATRRPVDSPVSTRLADGLACRSPHHEALEVIWQGVDRIVEVTDSEVAQAMRSIFECTHNVSEGAGAAALAAAMQEKHRHAGRKIAVTLSGGNIDRELFASVLDGSFS
ncbi:MAG: threonine dehydratase [Betaproteobacteria bacterium]|nr:threonine dehydratase [Betaproteobacteria bacterium]